MRNTIDQEELQTAKDKLKGWILAEQAVMTGQEYRTGTRMLRRARLKEIGERIKYWQSEVARLEGKPRNRAMQVIPRDI